MDLVSDELNIGDVAKFVLSVDGELRKAGMIASVICDLPLSITRPLNKFIIVLNAEGGVAELTEESIGRASTRSSLLLFKPEASDVLRLRPDGVRLYFDGSASDSLARKVSEYFRVLEAGFGLRGSRLKKPLVSFLSSGLFPVDADVWEKVKSMRDWLSHAYNSGEVAFESDALEFVQIARNFAADVLVHKKNWGSKDVERFNETYIVSHGTPDGFRVVVPGYPIRFHASFVDPVSGVAIHLKADAYGKNYLRYANLFLSSRRNPR